jgi:opacity protein-like surface antigen
MVNNTPGNGGRIRDRDQRQLGELGTMKFKTRIALALAVTALMPLAPALAADYDPPIYVDQAPEYTPVEIGSGWYLRGDVGYAFKQDYKNTSLSVDDALFYNDFARIGPLRAFSYSEHEPTLTGSVGVGYHFNDWLRADVNVGILANNSYSGEGHLDAGYLNPFGLVNSLNPAVTSMPDFGCLGARTVTRTTLDADGNPVGAPQVSVNNDWRRDCMVNASARASAWNGLANGYIDLGTYAGFTPYVGAGVGLLMTRTKASVGARCENSSTSQTVGNTKTDVDFTCRAPSGADYTTVASASKTDYDLLYGLSAGFSYQLSKNTSLDFGYQYLNAPGVKYYAIGDGGIEQRKGIDMHQVKVGLRYDLW